MNSISSDRGRRGWKGRDYDRGTEVLGWAGGFRGRCQPQKHQQQGQVQQQNQLTAVIKTDPTQCYLNRNRDRAKCIKLVSVDSMVTLAILRRIALC